MFRVLRQLSAADAMQRKIWPLWLRRLKFPNYSQFNRRVKTLAAQAVIAALSDHFRDRMLRTAEKAVDGRPLLVGGSSKDPDVHRGKVPGTWTCGHKLHAVMDSNGAVEAWEVNSLEVGEPIVAAPLWPAWTRQGRWFGPTPTMTATSFTYW